MQVSVLRLGWNPRASTPTLVDRLFQEREQAQRPLPSTPITSRTPITLPR
jgi:hypothetical protein